jgi:DNA-binding response OmpR family regulator
VKTVHVLIVEDEILVALDMEYVLEEGGFQVIGVAADKSSATLVQTSPTLAFVDLNLRDGPTGQEIARHFSEQYGTVIVYVTANPEQISQPAPTAIGYIQKPYSREAVLAAASLATGQPCDEVIEGLREFVAFKSAGFNAS